MSVTAGQLWLGIHAITWREIAKFMRQTERLLSALVRPALWLLVFATGLHDLLGVSIVPPYETYTPYQEYILPGLVGIVILFQCMQSALSMVYDREAGVMRVMLVTPLPRGFLLFAKIAAATILGLLQAYAFLLVAKLVGYGLPDFGYLTAIPAIVLAGLMLGSIGLLVSVYTPQIENFAGMMNFVVFPMFFLSSALYPLWKLQGIRRGHRLLAERRQPLHPRGGAHPLRRLRQARPGGAGRGGGVHRGRLPARGARLRSAGGGHPQGEAGLSAADNSSLIGPLGLSNSLRPGFRIARGCSGAGAS